MDAVAQFLPDGVGLGSAFLLVIASFFTSALTGAAGVGGGLTLLALMTYIVPIPALIPVHGTVQLGSNAGRAYLMRSHVAWALLVAFVVGAIPGAIFGRAIIGLLPDSGMKVLLGLVGLIALWVFG